MFGSFRLGRVIAHAVLTAALCVAVAVPLFAQTTSASVSGTVKDAQGGVLPGATVSLVSETKGTETSVVTNELGNFVFGFVPPDTYTMKITLEGFQPISKAKLQVNANDRLTAGVVTMVLGSLTESVTVQGQTSDIQLRSGERAFSLQASTMQNIAVNGRSFFGLAGLVPGIVPNTENPTQVSNLNANGQRSNSNNMTVDGVANIDTGDNGGSMSQTNIDAIAEIKVLTSSYQAEYGRAVGAQVQVVTKSGSQNFTGSGYWYARRSDWNANTWLNKRNGTALPKTSRNDSGFTLGGPLYIPGLFNEEKKNLFFFFSQEFQRRKDPTGETRVTVPTALERTGDFSQSVDSSGNPNPYIHDPLLQGVACNATNTAGCFQDGGVLGKVPADRLYSLGLNILKIFPMPNVTGQKTYNYASQTSGTSPLNQSMARLDYQANSNWRVTGRFMMHTNKSELPYGIGGWSIRSNLDDINVISDVPGRNWVVSTTGILSNTMSFEMSVGSGHNSLEHYSTSEKMTRAGSGLTSLPMLYTKDIQSDLIPQFSFSGVGNAPFYNTGQAPFTNFNTTYDVVANLTKILGTHSAKAGVYVQYSKKDQSAFAHFNGNYNFDKNSSNQYDTGHPFANAAVGVYNSFTQASSYLKPAWRYLNVEAYLQDNWRVNDKLTVDYGVRFYMLTPQWDDTYQASNFMPEEFVASKAVRLFQPSVVNGVRVGYDASTGTTVNSAFIGRIVPGSGDRFQATHQAGSGISDTMTDGNRYAVSPRLGFAYDVTGDQKVVARGGFGIFYDRPQGNQVFDLITNPPGLQVTTLNWGFVKDVASASGYNAPVGINANVYEWKLPTVYQWNLGAQFKLPAGFILDVAYVGSESRNLLQQRQINALPYGTTYLASSQDPTRGTGCTGCSGLGTLPGSNALPTDLLRPYQGYGAIRMWEFSAYANYKALQTTLSRRFDKGFMFTVNYNRSSAKGIAGGDWDGARIDGKDKEANYGPLAQDRPHVFVASFVYQSPKVADGVLGYLANDWQLSGVYRWMSGAPTGVGFSYTDGTGATVLTGSDQGARVVMTGDPGKGWSDDPYKMFDTSVFQGPLTGSNGLESARVYMNLPPTNNLDLSLSKSVPLYRKAKVEFRLDAFNALNTVQYSTVNTTANFASIANRTVITNLASPTNLTGFGAITGVRNPRQLQFMTRFSF